jgi:hypothetical protein
MYGVVTKEDLLEAPKNLAHLFEQAQQSSDMTGSTSEDNGPKNFVHQILKTGTQVSEEISYIKCMLFLPL